MAIIPLNASSPPHGEASKPVKIIKTVDVNYDGAVGDRPPIIPEYTPTIVTESIPIVEGESNSDYLERLKEEILKIKQVPLNQVDVEYDGIQILNTYNPVNITNGELSLVDLFIFVKNTYGQINDVIGANDSIYKALIDANGVSIEAVFSEVVNNTELITTVNTSFTVQMGLINLKVDTNKETTDGEISTINQLVIDQEAIILSAVRTELDAFGVNVSQNYATITLMNDSITSLVGQVEFNELGDVVSINTSAIVQLSNEISLTVTQIEFDLLSGEVTTNSASIVINSNKIALTIDENDEVIGGVIIEAINDDATVTIFADKINIDGTTTFSAGYDPYDKSTTFTAEPTTPYRIGDSWIRDSVIWTSSVDRLTGAFVELDWAIELNYSSDAQLQSFIDDVYTPFTEDIGEQVDGKVEYWFQSSDPVLDPNWGDETIRVGDTWYDDVSKKGYNWTRQGVDPNYTYQWELLEDQDALDALDDASLAQDTADNKRRVFTTTPFLPYDEGDLWLTSINPEEGDIEKCINSKAIGDALDVANDFVVASKYTDDTEANSKSTTWLDKDVDPSTLLGWGNDANHIGDVWYTYYDFGGSIGVEVQPHNWDGNNWILDVTKVDGGNIITGTVTASSILADNITSIHIASGTISADHITAGAITAGKLQVEDGIIANTIYASGGTIGGFSITNVLTNITDDNYRITLDANRASIFIEDNFGRTIDVRSGSLSSVNSLIGTNFAWDNLAYVGDYAYYDLSVYPSAMRAHIGDIENAFLHKTYVGVPNFATGGTAVVANVATADIVLEANGRDTSYTFDIPVSLGFKHDGGNNDGKSNKRYGSLEYIITVGIYDSNNVLVSSESKTTDSIFVNTEGTHTISLTSQHRLQVDVPDGGGSYYVRVGSQVAGTLQYQVWQNQVWPATDYWSSSEGELIPMDFGVNTFPSFVINAAAGNTEITTDGIQTVWSDTTYFRIDGNLPFGVFIESEGVWQHNGVIMDFTEETIGEIINLDQYLKILDAESTYLTILDASNTYISESTADTLYLGINATAVNSDKLDNHDSTQFLRSDINDETSIGIKTWFGGNILNQPGSAARIQVNGFIRTGNVFIHSGGLTPDDIRAADYLQNTNGDLQWYKDGVGLGTIWTSLNDGDGSGLDADTLDTYHASAFSRKAEDATITGTWIFNNPVTSPIYLGDNGGGYISRIGTKVVIANSSVNIGGVGLFHNLVERLNTISTGININGLLDISGDIQVNNSDTQAIVFDNRVGTVSKITRGEAGALYFHSDDNIHFYESDINELAVAMSMNNKSITSYGSIISNIINSLTDDLNIQRVGVTKLQITNTNNISLQDFQAPTFSTDNGGTAVSRSGTKIHIASSAVNIGGVGLYHDQSEKLNTISTGINIIGDLKGDGTFVSGFAGSNWLIDPDDNGDTHLTIDRLTVRGRMDVYELIVNQIRATNGSLWVTDSLKIALVAPLTTLVDINIYTELDELMPFVVGDILRVQKFTGDDIVLINGQVTNVGPSGVYPGRQFASVSYIGTPPRDLQEGDSIVRIGNATDTSRQGALYLTSSDNGSPYMDIIDGVTDGSLAGHSRIRLGKLDGVNSETGYGIWGSSNGTDTNFVISSDGYANIAGWNFNKESIYKDFQSLGSDVWMGVDSKLGAGTSVRGFGVTTDVNNRIFFGQTTSDSLILQGTSNGSLKFRLSNTDNIIAGWNFDEDSLWTGTKWGTGNDHGVTLRGGATPLIMTSKDSTNYTLMKYSSDTDWGIGGFNNGINVFQLGSTNKIAGWNFDDDALWTGTKFGTGGNGLTIQGGAVPLIALSQDSNNFVYLTNIGSSNWGIRGNKDGITVFQLGNENRIAGWTFTDGELQNEIAGQYISISNKESGTISDSRGRRGLVIYNNDTTLHNTTTSIKAIRVGRLSDEGTLTAFTNTDDYGIQIWQGTTGGGNEVFRAGRDGARIAGWGFDNTKLLSESNIISLHSDGYIQFKQLSDDQTFEVLRFTDHLDNVKASMYGGVFSGYGRLQLNAETTYLRLISNGVVIGTTGGVNISGAGVTLDADESTITGNVTVFGRYSNRIINDGNVASNWSTSSASPTLINISRKYLYNTATSGSRYIRLDVDFQASPEIGQEIYIGNKYAASSVTYAPSSSLPIRKQTETAHTTGTYLLCDGGNSWVKMVWLDGAWNIVSHYDS